MSPTPEDWSAPEMNADALLQFIAEEHRAIRAIAHDIASPIGILRLAMYVLRTMNPDETKREQYYDTMNQAIDKLEDHIRRLRALTEAPPSGTPADETQP